MNNVSPIHTPHLLLFPSSDLLRMVDKEYNRTANYAKGTGDQYADWLGRFRPGRRYLPIVRVLGGNRQDASFEGAFPIYDSMSDMLKYTDQCLMCSENILQQSLFIVLSSMETIAQLRIASILYLSVIIPMRWLAGNTHKLAHRNWGEKSMGRALDLIYHAFVKIQADGSLLLIYDFIMNIFSPLYDELPELKDYLDFHLEEKEGNVIGSVKEKDRVLVIDEAMEELFYPKRRANRETTELCTELAVGVATTLLTELLDKKKVTSYYVLDGKWSWKNVTPEQVEASLGIRANNDGSEGMFATLTDVLVTGGRIDLSSAAGIGMARYNNDMGRGLFPVTGKKRKREVKNKERLETGLFHQLPEELQNSFLSMAKKNSGSERRVFEAALKRQRAARVEKDKMEMLAKEKKSADDYIGATYCFQMFHSPRRWTTVEHALDQYERLTTKTARMKHVRDQILMRYVGLGFGEAYHPWSKEGRQYTAAELLKHLIEVVIPLDTSKMLPDRPPLNLPKRPDLAILGTLSADRKDLDNTCLAKEQRIRLNAMLERDRREDNGRGDQLMEMQEAVIPVDRMRKGGFKVDICFEFDDVTGPVLEWCQGTVVRLIKYKEDQNHLKMEVRWDEECLREGDMKLSVEKCLKSKWNPEKHTKGAWREDLHQLVIDAENAL